MTTSHLDRSYLDNSEMDCTKYTNESAWEESFEVDQKMETLLAFNKNLLEGFNHFLQRDIPALIESYKAGLDTLERGKSPNHLENLITMKSNLGIAYYFNNEIEKAISLNEEALKLILNNGRAIDRQLESIQSLYIKVLCNLIVFKMVQKEDNECIEIAEKLINFLNSCQNSKRKRLFIKETIYILFRLESLSGINSDYVAQMKRNIQEANQGCFLLMIGVYSDCKGDGQNTLGYYTQAFDVFDELKDELFMLLTARMIVSYCHLNHIKNDFSNKFESYYMELSRDPFFKDIRLDLLFENFDRRIELAKAITKGLQDIESSFRDDQYQGASSFSIKNPKESELTVMELANNENNAVWKLAVKLALKRSIVSAKTILGTDRDLNSHKRQQLIDSIGQISTIVKLFEGEYNPIILEKLMKDNYAREAINNLRIKVAKIERGVKKIFFAPTFNRLFKKARISRRKSFLVESQVAYKHFLKVSNGDYLEKYNYTSGGHRKHFFKIVDQKTLRWCRDKKNITKASKCHCYDLFQIRGIVFGKVTKTFLKSKNKDTEPWRCMSLIMEKRPFDIYCSEENTNNWYSGLAYAIKKHNPNAYCLSVGKFLWRKLRILLTYIVMDKMGAASRKKLKKELSFTKAVIGYGKLKFVQS